ncbi:Cloroperoxidase [Mycena floridula]|nr:Cloroperoxidase [Mycena floridula]
MYPSSSATLSALPLLGVFSGFPWSRHNWQAPGPNDLRSPCPGLNVLANHGYLPRNGRGFTVPMILDAGLAVYNIAPEVLILPAHLGLLTSGQGDTFTLDDIKLHNAVEHDASLSRSDFAVTGDNLHFNETIFQTLASSNPGVNYYNATSAGTVMRQRLEDSRRVNPAIKNTSKELLMRIAESTLYLTVMGNNTGVAPKEFVNIFFREERLPIAEGWKRPATTLTFAIAAPIQGALAQISQWTPGPGTLDPSIVVVVHDNTTVVF